MKSEPIENPLIRQNLEVLCEAIKDLNGSLQRQIDLEFFCDLKTGQILYTPSMIPPHEMAILIMNLDLDRNSISWKTKEKEKLEGKAEALLKEMRQILKKAFISLRKLGDLTQFHWQKPLENVGNGNESSILQHTWHPVDREEAERLLLKRPAGTFFFRKDRYAGGLEEILKRGHKKAVQCYTLTYMDDENIIRDKTVVFINNKWTFYEDDPQLSGPSYHQVGELVHSMGSTLRHPLLAHKVLG